MTDSSRRQFLLRTITSCGAGALMLSACGCQLFQHQLSDMTSRTSLLPQIPPSRNAVQLEVIIIERPQGDPLLEKSLWKEVDQIGALDPDVRDILQKNGFKVGVTASDPPEALQTMVQQAIEKNKRQITHGQQAPSSLQKVALLEGTSSDLQTSNFFSTCQVTIQKKTGDVKKKTFENARCLFRVEAHRLQEGWVTLQFIPEIQHGAKQLRHTAGKRNWKLTTSQAKYSLYEQQFEITLNMGEMAMISSQGESPNSLGQQFFSETKEDKEAVQRLLVVRLVSIATAQGVKTE
ncbi:hypothetical protein MNBD_PLANCTO02-395 [hydrothermal vent metagenome]|uniref:Lipoprotein n=1 Tax=hydrothermal vent metagenome TaxID=652676 RepID=A0A3B1DYI3_9ZZZZ